MMSAVNFLILISLICDIVTCINHCQDHRYETRNSTTYMQFTKEAVDRDYAVSNQFKSLHCCAKGYRSIEWWVFQFVSLHLCVNNFTYIDCGSVNIPMLTIVPMSHVHRICVQFHGVFGNRKTFVPKVKWKKKNNNINKFMNHRI